MYVIKNEEGLFFNGFAGGLSKPSFSPIQAVIFEEPAQESKQLSVQDLQQALIDIRKHNINCCICRYERMS